MPFFINIVMKNIFIAIAMMLYTQASISTVIRGQDGRWYGNICITQVGWQEVPWQLVGSICYSPMWQNYGFIANV